MPTCTPSCGAREGRSIRTRPERRPMSSSSLRGGRRNAFGFMTRVATCHRSRKKSRPLTDAHFAAFKTCFGEDPKGGAARNVADSPDDRWRAFSIDQVRDREYKIDSFKWLRDDERDDVDEAADPAELLADALAHLRQAVSEIERMQQVIDSSEVDE